MSRDYKLNDIPPKYRARVRQLIHVAYTRGVEDEKERYQMSRAIVRPTARKDEFVVALSVPKGTARELYKRLAHALDDCDTGPDLLLRVSGGDE